MPVSRSPTVLHSLLLFHLGQSSVQEQEYTMSTNFSFIMVLIIICTGVMGISSRTVESTDLLNNIQSPVMIARNYPNLINPMEDSANGVTDRFCQIEYQVTRKRTGTCVKLGHGVTGCMSGDYMNPFHPDCL